jgi:outer membrane protein assembly factor BamB
MIKKLIIVLLILLLLGGLTTGCALGDQPEGWSGMVMVDNALFLGSMEGELVAVDVSSHNRLWSDVTLETTSTGTTFGCAAGSSKVAVYGTPASADGLVYVGGYNGKVYAYASDSGALRWVYPREGNIGPIVGGPVVALGMVYAGSADGEVYALDVDTGDKKWGFETGDKIWATPVIDGETLYIGSFDNKLYALDANTGREKWDKPFESGGPIASSPIVLNNTIYIGSFDRHLYAVNTISGEQIWQYPVKDESGNELGKWFWAKPIIYNNTIYAGNLDGKIYVINAKTGMEAVAPFDLQSPISSSPVLAGNLVVVATEDGKVYSVDTETRQIRFLATLGEKINAPLLFSEVEVTPEDVAPIVYVHGQEPETLYALNVKTGITLWRLELSK